MSASTNQSHNKDVVSQLMNFGYTREECIMASNNAINCNDVNDVYNVLEQLYDKNACGKHHQQTNNTSNNVQTIDQLNIVIGEYFAACGDNTYYSDIDKKGIFKIMCDDIGFDKLSDIDDDLFVENPQDSLFGDNTDNAGLIDNFPLPSYVSDNKDERLTEMINILQYCYLYNCAPCLQATPSPPPNNSYNIFDFNLKNINDDNVQNIRDLYINKIHLCSEALSIFKWNDYCLKTLSIGFDQKNYNFLQYIIDSYTRDRVYMLWKSAIGQNSYYNYKYEKRLKKQKTKTKIETKTFRDIISWIKYHFNRLNILQLTYNDINDDDDDKDNDKNESSMEMITKTLYKVSMKWILPFKRQQEYVICDDIADISRYIAGITQFIKDYLLIKQNVNAPFQFDVIIGFQKRKRNLNINPGDNDNKYNEDDVIGNINDTLTYEKCLFVDNVIQNKCNIIKSIIDTYTKFNTKMISYDNNYPTHRRFCLFIDRRRMKQKFKRKFRQSLLDKMAIQKAIELQLKSNGTTQSQPNYNELVTKLTGTAINNFKKEFINKDITCKDDLKDKIVMFNPPNDCNTIPKQYIPQTLHSMSQKCLIPKKGYNERLPQKSIRTFMEYKGQILTFSFHVKTINEITCYLYYGTQSIRFYPEDIINVLPHIFDNDYGNNKLFHQTDTAKRMTNGIYIKDKYFEHFYSHLTDKKILEFPYKYHEYPYIKNDETLVSGYIRQNTNNYKNKLCIKKQVNCLIIQFYRCNSYKHN